LGADVRVVCGDLATPGAAEAAVAAARTGGLRLAGVVHGAGVRADGLVTDVREADLARVWGPKARGAWRLDAAVRAAGAAGELDWWVSLSSAAALLGSPGQSVYAGANAWLDGFAGWQRANGIPAISVHYGVWAGVGGAAAVRLPGLRATEPDDAVAALEELLSREPGATGVVPLDIAAAAAAYPEIARLPFFTDRLAAATPVTAAGSTGPEAAGPGVAGLRNLPSRQAVRLVGDQIGARIAAVLGASGPPGRDTPLADLGLDSLAAIRIKNLVERDFGVAVPTAVLVRGATLADLERSVAAELGIRANGAPVSLPEPAVEGRDAAERLVLQAVREVLGPVPCGVTDRLDRIAPPDALARVTALLRQRTGVDVGAVVLAAAPTAERLAAPLRAADEAEVRRGVVRELRPAAPPPTRPGSARPLFLAHPAGGTTVVYRQLVDLLGPDQPCYGLERLDDVGPVEERAARYLELLAAAQPVGPYRLGGWSFGGVLAFEMARQLAAAGERVELLGLIDAGLPLPVSRRRDTELLVRRFVAFGAYLRRTYGAQVRLSAEDLHGLPEDGQFDLVQARIADSGLSERLPEAIMRHQITSHRDTRALDRYEPGEYTGPVVLYRCTEPTPWNVRDPRYEHTDLDRGFGRWCADLRVVPVTAHHLNVLDPPAVNVVAADLDALLSAAPVPPKGVTA
ncbi:KR domain-containing protein, partial [Micromonospora sp. CPCC 205371]|nr:KR domain-containing protein [Micromonospora sp. CPCC 205371]